MREPRTGSRFPDGEDLGRLLNLAAHAELSDLWSRVLTGPLDDLFGRPSKEFRAEIVRLGYGLASAGEIVAPEAIDACEKGAEILELLHAGSLVVDDIQDGSRVRRGAAALHERYGVPVALNAANWLYFWPLFKIEELPLADGTRLRLYRDFFLTLVRAHYGQALDVGVTVGDLPQERVPAVANAALELKSGTLMALAMKLGGYLAEATPEALDRLGEFGLRFGSALQMCDDIGNLTSRDNPAKRFEDLRLQRPGYIWAQAAATLGPGDYARFCVLVRNLPESAAEIDALLARHSLVIKARSGAKAFLSEALVDLRGAFPASAGTLTRVEQLAWRLLEAYG